MIWYILLTFIMAFAVDLCWAIYVKAIANDQYHLASVFSVAMSLLGLLGTFIIFQEITALIGWTAGLYLGTYCSKYFKKLIHKETNGISSS